MYDSTCLKKGQNLSIVSCVLNAIMCCTDQNAKTNNKNNLFFILNEGLFF